MNFLPGLHLIASIISVTAAISLVRLPSQVGSFAPLAGGLLLIVLLPRRYARKSAYARPSMKFPGHE